MKRIEVTFITNFERTKKGAGQLLRVFQSACVRSAVNERIFVEVDIGFSYETLLRNSNLVTA